MIKLIMLFIVLNSTSIDAQTHPGFAGCGEYLLKGVLVKNTPVLYKVNGGTNSEMQFKIKESDDLVLISSYLDVPTEIKAHINKVMDGTRGEIDHISKVTLRKSNPLEPLKDSGIFLTTPGSCH
jgi:hypothetical protein